MKSTPLSHKKAYHAISQAVRGLGQFLIFGGWLQLELGSLQANSPEIKKPKIKSSSLKNSSNANTGAWRLPYTFLLLKWIDLDLKFVF